MKIIFTCNRIGTGGAERVICNFANQLVRDNHEVKIVCLDVLDGFFYPIENQVRIIELDKNYSKRKSFLDRKTAGLQNFFSLYKVLRRERPDIVITFYTRQSCYSILAGSMLGIPVIVSERDHFFLGDSLMNKYMRRLFYPHAAGFIHQTNWAREYLRRCCGIQCDDIVLPNPIWFSEFPERKPVRDRIIAIGRLDDQKNYAGLIRAFAEVKRAVPSSELYIYGEGCQRKMLEDLATQIGVSVWLPGVSKDVASCYAEADLFVLFSHGEGYPNVLMEALAMGVPCVAADCPVGGPADMIVDGVNGLLVKNGDEGELAEKIIMLLGNESLKTQFSIRAVDIRNTNEFGRIYSKLMNYVASITARTDVC